MDLAPGGAAVPVQVVEAFPEFRALGGDFAFAVQGTGSAVEDQFVLAAHRVDIDHRQTAGLDALAQHGVAQGLLGGMEGGGVEHQQQFGPGGLGLLRGSGQPDVLADQETAAHARHLDHGCRITRHEGADLVEHGMIGQALLAVDGLDAALVEDDSGVVALLALLEGRADDRGQVRRQPSRQVREDPRVLGIEVVAQGQVLGRIAAEGQFRGDEEIGPLRSCLAGEFGNAAGIALEVADGGVELGEGDLHGPE